MTHFKQGALTATEARHVLYVYEGDPLGMAPGGFVTKLLEAASVADLTNLSRLAVGFPGYVEAVYLFKFEVGGLDTLRKIAQGQETG